MRSHTPAASSRPSPPGEATAESMARQICRGFMAHDRGRRQEAVTAFEYVDSRQFPHLDADDAHLAATAFVDALWAKDDLELQFLGDGTLDDEGLRAADWGPVRAEFRERAAAIGLDQEYARLKTEAWRRHKTGGDYWSPFQQAQVMELRAALQDADYPNKPKEGASGLGPEAGRYALAVELHDMHTERHWAQAVETMVPYFDRILSSHTDDE